MLKNLLKNLFLSISLSTITAVFIKYVAWDICWRLFPKLVEEGWVPEDPEFLPLLMFVVTIRLIVSDYPTIEE